MGLAAYGRPGVDLSSYISVANDGYVVDFGQSHTDLADFVEQCGFDVMIDGGPTSGLIFASRRAPVTDRA
jgi:hypothetical protein